MAARNAPHFAAGVARSCLALRSRGCVSVLRLRWLRRQGGTDRSSRKLPTTTPPTPYRVTKIVEATNAISSFAARISEYLMPHSRAWCDKCCPPPGRGRRRGAARAVAAGMGGGGSKMAGGAAARWREGRRQDGGKGGGERCSPSLERLRNIDVPPERDDLIPRHLEGQLVLPIAERDRECVVRPELVGESVVPPAL